MIVAPRARGSFGNPCQKSPEQNSAEQNVAIRVHRPLVAIAVVGAVTASCAVGAAVYERTQRSSATRSASLLPVLRHEHGAVGQKGTTLQMPATTPSYLAPCYADQAAVPLAECLAGTKARYAAEVRQFPSVGSRLISITEAETMARTTPGTPAAARLLSYLQASAAIGEHGLTSPFIPGTTPVWLVTVYGPGGAPGPPGNAPGATGTSGRASAYTVMMDAIDGRQIVTCTSCTTVPLP